MCCKFFCVNNLLMCAVYFCLKLKLLGFMQHEISKSLCRKGFESFLTGSTPCQHALLYDTLQGIFNGTAHYTGSIIRKQNVSAFLKGYVLSLTVFSSLSKRRERALRRQPSQILRCWRRQQSCPSCRIRLMRHLCCDRCWS